MIAFPARFVAAALCVAVVGTAARGEDALYGDVPGEKAVFVRFVNALDTSVSITSDLLPTLKIGVDGKERVSSYRLIERGDVSSLTFTATTGDAEVHEKIEVKAGTKVSIVLRRDGNKLHVSALAVPSEINQSHPVLSFTNAAPLCGPTSLILEPGNATIFAKVPVDGERSRKVNAVSALVSAGCGDLGKATAKLERQETGSGYSVWLISLQGHPALILGTNALPTWHP